MNIAATIHARHFTAGRVSPVRLVVLHTTEGDTAVGVARKVAAWFAGPAAPQASAHYVVGPDEVLACVDEEDTAWHAPPVNPYAIGIEMVGRAAYTADDWQRTEVQEMLERAVELVVDICSRRGIPAVAVDEAGLIAGVSGITTHATVSRAFHKTDHTDPGVAFPIDEFLAQACAALAPTDP